MNIASMIRMSVNSRLVLLRRRWSSKANVAFNRHPIPSTLLLLALVHALLWIAAPLLYVDGMHVDTLEMAAWSQKLALGYPKHPPLGTWLVAIATQLPGNRIFNLLMLSQLALLATAGFIWKTARIFASQVAAALAVVLFLESAAATVFSIQVNHNLLSMPFEAALLYFGLSFLEAPTRAKAIPFGLVAALALLTKYETIFFHLSLVGLCVIVPRYRRAFIDPRSYLAIAVCCGAIAPHLAWDWRHGWQTMAYAAADRPITAGVDALRSLNQLIDGLFVLAVGPSILIASVWRMTACARKATPIGFSLLIGVLPLAILLFLSGATMQVIRQGWLLPLAPALAISAALIVAARRDCSILSAERIGWSALRLSTIQVLLVSSFIVVRSMIGAPVASYAFDSSELSKSLAVFWRSQSNRPLECLAVDAREYTLGPILYLDPMPAVEYVDKVAGRPCRDGGLAVLPAGSLDSERLAKAGFVAAELRVTPELGLGSFAWPIRAFYLPPES